MMRKARTWGVRCDLYDVHESYFLLQPSMSVMSTTALWLFMLLQRHLHTLRTYDTTSILFADLSASLRFVIWPC